MLESVLAMPVLHLALSVVCLESILHDSGFVDEVMFWESESFSGVAFIGKRHFDPRNSELVSEPYFVSLFLSGSDRSLCIWVPLKVAEPMGERFPCMVWDGVSVAAVLKVDAGVAVVSWVNI